MRRFLIILFLLTPKLCFGAIAIETNATAVQTDGSSTCTVTIDVGSGSDRYLLVSATLEGTTSIDSATYDSVSMTLADSVQIDNNKVGIFYLANPNAGSNDAVVTFSGSSNSVCHAIAFTGVDQTAPDVTNTANNVNDSPTVSCTTTADNSWVFDAATAANSGRTIDGVGAGQTSRFEQANGGSHFSFGSTEGPVSPAGATTMSWTMNDSDTWRQVCVGFAPASGGGGGVNDGSKYNGIKAITGIKELM